MSMHPNLPIDGKVHKIYKIPLLSREIINFIKLELSLKCDNCGDRGPVKLHLHPSKTVKDKPIWYHVGCDGCKIHAVDVCIWNTGAVFHTYYSSHPIQVVPRILQIKNKKV